MSGENPMVNFRRTNTVEYRNRHRFHENSTTDLTQSVAWEAFEDENVWKYL